MHPQRYLGLALTICLLSLLTACGGGGGDGNGGGSGGGSSGNFVTAGIDAPVYAVMLADDTTRLVFVTDAQMLYAIFRGDSGPAEAPVGLTNEEGDSLELTAGGDGYTGTFTAASGESLEVTLEKVSRDNGGLHRNRETIRGEDWIIGLIVLNDGKVVGAARNEVTGAVDRRTTLSLGIKWTDPAADP